MRAFSPYMKRFARPCSIKTEQGEILNEMQAFICPLRYKNKMYLYGVNTEIGFNPEGYYLYIGPPEISLEGENGYIESGGEKYRIDRNERVYLGSEVLYIWAIIRRMTEEENE